MSWTDDLVTAIKEAIASEQPGTILVPNESQKGLGESALTRMAPGATHIRFVIDQSVGRSAQWYPEVSIGG